MKKLVYLIIFFLYSTVMNAQLKDLVQYVNTLQGTDSNFGLSYGNTYPTTGMPYGMHMWSAQTGKNGDGFKYMYAVDKIRAFSQSHQCSPWVSDYAVYSFMPMVGELVVNQDARATKFSHDNEIAKPHYYKVTFGDGPVGGIGRGLRDDYRQPQCRRQSGYLLERLLQHAGLGLRRFLL